MASPTTAAAPDAPSGSSPLSINGQPRLVGWFQEICTNFLKLLSPSGASAYDTGWIDTTAGTGFTIQAGGYIRYRRIGKIVYLSIRDVSANSAGAATMATLPVAPSMETPLAFATNTASSVSHASWIATSGQVRATWATGNNYRIHTSFPVN